jgi:LAO/AO transport system kinase
MVSSIEAMLALQPPAGSWTPPVLKTVATHGDGIPELLTTLDRFRQSSRPLVDERRGARVRTQLRDHVTGLFLQRLDHAVPAPEIERIADAVASRKLDPRSAAGQVLARVCVPRES